ncbi:PREDICTED: calmodulin-like protein 11 isoform X1 [Ceratosolen solmsi marchali]|uniref:Ubiquitin-conjugating enzyme E2 S n=1 Tax=Ceratosolen solmsi marchali TaxID=326594 RepID=A0AAJ6YTC7_9HYME|nr:PREDICTED: calmodulin-like protein 11 isoform X1 [Ceratosolen solmsi marchali]
MAVVNSVSNVENLTPQITRQVVREINELRIHPPEGIQIVLNEENITDVQAIIDGPAGTPYFSGSFRIKLTLGKDYPQGPPKAFFLTKIFHPNVAKNGEICVNTLKKDWRSDLGIKHILLTVKCLLIMPNAESALNEEAGKLLLERYDDYSERAKMMTEIHAQDDLTKDQIALLKKAFNAFDHEKKGCIGTDMVGTILSMLGYDLTESTLQEIIAEVDEDGSGQLEFEEFCTLSARFLVEEDTEAMQQELREAFRLYDKEGNGYITTEVFRDILHELDDKLSPEELDLMIEEIDADGSGTLDFDEFMEVMTGGDE